MLVSVSAQYEHCHTILYLSLFLPPAYVVRREGNVLTRVCPSICLSTGGLPISHNALQHFPECHGADTWGGTLPGPGGGGGGYPARSSHVGYPPHPPARSWWGGGYPAGGYPGRATEGVLTTRRAVCLLRSRRRTFLLDSVNTPLCFPLFLKKSPLLRDDDQSPLLLSCHCQ